MATGQDAESAGTANSTRRNAYIGLTLLLAAAVVIGVQAWTLGRVLYGALFEDGALVSPWWLFTRGLNTAFAFYGALAIQRGLRCRGRSLLLICVAGFVGLCVLFVYANTPFFLPAYVAAHLVAIIVLIALDIQRLAFTGFFQKRVREKA